MDLKKRTEAFLSDKRLVTNHFSKYLRSVPEYLERKFAYNRSMHMHRSVGMVSLMVPSFDIYKFHALDETRIYSDEVRVLGDGIQNESINQSTNFFDKISFDVYGSYIFTEVLAYINTILDPLVETKNYSIFGLVDEEKFEKFISRHLNFPVQKTTYTVPTISTKPIYEWLFADQSGASKPRPISLHISDADLEHRSYVQDRRYCITNILKQSIV